MRRKAIVLAGEGRCGRQHDHRLFERDTGHFRGVLLQPERQGQLRDKDREGNVKNALEPEFLHQGTAAEQGQRVRCRPDDVVGADGTREALGVLTLAHQRLDGRPQKTHANGEHHAGQNQTGRGVKL
jgi:hypothetical protein